MTLDEQLRADEAFMRMALKEAEKAGTNGEIPIGAVIVCNGRIISRAHNLTGLHPVRDGGAVRDVRGSIGMEPDRESRLWSCRRQAWLQTLRPRRLAS